LKPPKVTAAALYFKVCQKLFSLEGVLTFTSL
jgi:hypothetical protein